MPRNRGSKIKRAREDEARVQHRFRVQEMHERKKLKEAAQKQQELYAELPQGTSQRV
jgi:hypothetical protein